MNGLDRADFGRFAVAYGPSVPAGEADELGLPSEFEEVRRPMADGSAGGIDGSISAHSPSLRSLG
jgi:hypothetical protein